MVQYFIGLWGMKLLKLKLQMHMKLVFGILHGTPLAISFAVAAMIRQQSSGAEIGLGIQLVINSIWDNKVWVIKTMFLVACLVIFQVLSPHQLLEHLPLACYELRVQYLELELHCHYRLIHLKENRSLPCQFQCL